MKRWLFSVMIVVCLVGTVWGGEIETINSKAAFPEGPVWHNGRLYYVEYGAHRVTVWDGKKNTLFWQMDGSGPSAIIPVAGGDFLVTGYDNGTIIRLSSEGKTLAVYKQDQNGKPFIGPNDFAADAKGGVYFTASGPWESAPINGRIFYLDKDGRITEVADDLHYANGLALTKDGRTLFCAESEAHRVIRFNVREDSTLSDRTLFVRIGEVDAQSGANGYPDGLKIDPEGNLVIGQYSMGRILVVNPEGKLLRAIAVPSTASPNMNFSPDGQSLFVTAVDDVEKAPYWGKVYKIIYK